MLHKNNLRLRRRLFFSYNREDFCEKYRYDTDTHEEDNFSEACEKYCRKSKYARERINNCSYFFLCESEFHKPEMKMTRLFSFHRIFPSSESGHDDIDKVDEIYSEDAHGSCDFSSSDNRESGYEKCEHNRSRIPHDKSSFDISFREKEGCRNDNCKECENKTAVFFTCHTFIYYIELYSKSCEDNKRYQCKTSSESRNSIGKIHSIENKDIPENRYQEREQEYRNMV
jgi:hypothetical protein